MIDSRIGISCNSMKSAEAWYQEGLAALQLSRSADYHSEYVGDLEAAVAAFEQALATDSAHAGAVRSLGFALARLGRHAEAVAAMDSALKHAPGDVDLKLSSAQSLQSMGEYARAVEAYNDVLRARPRDPEALFGRAEALEASNRDREALEAWEAVLNLPDNRALNIHGERYEVLTTDFRTLRALLSRALALARLGREPEAAEGYTELLEGAWTALHGPMLQDRFVQSLREVESARVVYRRFLQRARTPSLRWRQASETWLRAGFAEEALAASTEAVRLAPSDGDAVWQKGEALAKAGQLKEAVETLRRALALHPVARLGIAARLKVMEQELAALPPPKWKVMGRDTFAREHYLVGEFASAEEAEERLREKEAAVDASQDESLRDAFWIVPPEPGRCLENG